MDRKAEVPIAPRKRIASAGAKRPEPAPKRQKGMKTPPKTASPTMAGEPSIVERVYDNARSAILAGVYKPGQQLRLKELASDNEASFIPVREALRLLEMARLVEIIPNKGARVTDISEADMIDAYDLRVILEAMAVERACSRITAAELARAEACYANMLKAMEDGDVERASVNHIDFHLTLYHAARSPWLTHIVELLMASTERYRRLLTPARPKGRHLAATRDQHRDILEAVRRGDEAVACECLRNHLQESVQRFRKKLGERL
jgi:DNA-binding GntR family transcriptional regulator